MADSFGLKIGLEGEKEFKKALAEINQSFKVLGSEMKLATSQFDKNDKSVEALAARNKVLRKEIDEQTTKIDTLRKALRAMRGHVTPCRAAHEQRRPILVLAGLLVVYARGVCDGEAGDLRALAGGSQFRIRGEVADDGDDGLAYGHVIPLSRIRPVPGRAGWDPWPSTRISRAGIRPRGR